MRRLLPLLALVLLSAILVACGSAEPRTREQGAAGSVPTGFNWDRDPSTIIVRLDARYGAGSAADTLNAIPPCTLWGDGRVVWVSQGESGEEVVLEARAADDAVRAFLEDIISRGFYDWEDDISPGDETTLDQSITVYLYDELRTVRRHTSWPDDGYEALLAACQQLSATPVLVMPWGGWVSAYPTDRKSSLPQWFWPEDAAFTPDALVANGEAHWLRGDLIADIWAIIRNTANEIQVIGPDGSAYELALAVPGISRDAAAPPPGQDQPLPSPAPALTPGAVLDSTAEPAS